MKLTTIEATIDENGTLIVDDQIDLKGKRVLITILPTAGDGHGEPESETSIARLSSLISESALAKYWDLPEEDEAWAHLNDL